MNQKSANYLVGKIDQKYLCFLSGIQPILTTAHKAELKQKTDVETVDMLSLLLTEELQNTILDYYNLMRGSSLLEKWFKYGGILTSNSNFKQNGQKQITAGKLALANLIEYYKKRLEVPAEITNLETAIKGNITFDNIKGPFKNAQDIISKLLNILKENAINAAKIYFTSLSEYANKIFATNIKEGLQFFNTMSDDDKLAYIVDATTVKLSETDGQTVYPVIQLTHTEPMYISKNEKKTDTAYFFSYKDMCVNCSRLVKTATETGLLPIKFIVLSQQYLVQGNVDFSYSIAMTFPSKHIGNILPNVAQMRIEDIGSFDINTQIIMEFSKEEKETISNLVKAE